jgi:hypothetical protein
VLEFLLQDFVLGNLKIFGVLAAEFLLQDLLLARLFWCAWNISGRISLANFQKYFGVLAAEFLLQDLLLARFFLVCLEYFRQNFFICSWCAWHLEHSLPDPTRLLHFPKERRAPPPAAQQPPQDRGTAFRSDNPKLTHSALGQLSTSLVLATGPSVQSL